ncbi:hypothetical protein K227x_22540 [Rubripirellula lacrimiformis]|uniref:Uncharacterized protein n=1 Tax=Rubripirellula lacrimiformis TaxID=1930273 RepID=A0A517N9Q8_9BACT|nr:hypothetical protein K227x_22540 [Rubripirellula lacrimiformis]
MGCNGGRELTFLRWRAVHAAPLNPTVPRLTYSHGIAMARNDPMLIDNTATLLAHLESCRITFQWLIPPQAGHSILLSPSHLRLLVDDAPVASCPLMSSFNRFVCVSIGEIKHTPGTTNSAIGSLKLSTCMSDRMLEIDYDCAELPSVEGSCYSGGGLISVPLTDFLLDHTIP